MELFDIQAERRLIGMLMRRPSLWDEVADSFTPQLFAHEFHQEIAKAIREETKPGQQLVPSRVMRRIGLKNEQRVRDIMGMVDDIIAMDEFRGLVAMLRDLSARRSIRDYLLRGQDALTDLSVPLNEVLGEIQSGMLQAASTHGHDGTREWDELLADRYGNMVERREGKAESAWPVGLERLGEVLKGIRRKHLIIVAGRPSMGKTTFAQFWAMHLAKRGVASYVFCPDQSAEEIADRALWNAANIDGVRWDQTAKWTEDEWNRANAAFSKLMGLPIKINDRRGMTPEEICAIARREKAANPGLGLIVIDHLTALNLKGNRNLNWSKIVGDAAKTFKNLSEELDVAVVLLSQLNRSLESRDDKRPTMADLRDSGEIEEHANEILFLYREEYYRPDLEGIANVCEIHVAKQKQGPRGETALVKFEPKYARFSDLTVFELNAYINAIESAKSKRGRATA